MKKIFIILLFILGAFTVPQSIYGCTQSHQPCEDPEDPGIRLICGAPYVGPSCYAGGCGFGVIVVTCIPDEQ